MSDQRKPNYNGPDLVKEKREDIKSATPAFEEIRKDIDSLQSDVSNLAVGIGKVGSDKARAAISYVNKNVDSLKDSGTEAFKKVEDHIKSKPGQSITIAFAAGLLTSYLFNRRS